MPMIAHDPQNVKRRHSVSFRLLAMATIFPGNVALALCVRVTSHDHFTRPVLPSKIGTSTSQNSRKWRAPPLKKFKKMAPFGLHTAQRHPMLSQPIPVCETSDVQRPKVISAVSSSQEVPSLPETKMGSSNSSEVELGTDPMDGVVLTINWPSQSRQNRQILPLKKKPLIRPGPPRIFRPFTSCFETELTVRTLRDIVERSSRPSIFNATCLNINMNGK